MIILFLWFRYSSTLKIKFNFFQGPPSCFRQTDNCEHNRKCTVSSKKPKRSLRRHSFLKSSIEIDEILFRQKLNLAFYLTLLKKQSGRPAAVFYYFLMNFEKYIDEIVSIMSSHEASICLDSCILYF